MQPQSRDGHKPVQMQSEQRQLMSPMNTAYLVISVKELRRIIRKAHSTRIGITTTERRRGSVCAILDLEMDPKHANKTGAAQANILNIR